MLGFTHLQSENSTVILSAHDVGTLKAGAKTINQGEEIPHVFRADQTDVNTGFNAKNILVWLNLI